MSSSPSTLPTFHQSSSSLVALDKKDPLFPLYKYIRNHYVRAAFSAKFGEARILSETFSEDDILSIPSDDLPILHHKIPPSLTTRLLNLAHRLNNYVLSSCNHVLSLSIESRASGTIPLGALSELEKASYADTPVAKLVGFTEYACNTKWLTKAEVKASFSFVQIYARRAIHWIADRVACSLSLGVRSIVNWGKPLRYEWIEFLAIAAPETAQAEADARGINVTQLVHLYRPSYLGAVGQVFSSVTYVPEYPYFFDSGVTRVPPNSPVTSDGRTRDGEN